MRKIAFLGSRTWKDTQRIALQINACYAEHGKFVLLSGGAEGANTIAEQVGKEFGIPVASFRPVKINDECYGVHEWRMHRGQAKIVPNEITWADWQSACNYRSTLIAERCDEAWIYWDGYSRGTRFEIELIEAGGKYANVIDLKLEK